MARQSNGDERKLTVLRPDAVIRVGEYDAEVIERCFAIWSTKAGQRDTVTARYYAAEVEEGTPTPTAECIRKWSIKFGWEERSDREYHLNHGESIHAMQRQVVAIVQGHLAVSLDAQSGAFDANPMAGAIRLKPGEQVGRWIERGIVPLFPKPQTEETQDEQMSLEEKEAYLRGKLQARKQASGG